MKKLTLQNLNLVLSIVGILILLLAYFLGYKPLTEKNDEVTAELSKQTEYLEVLDGYADNATFYKEETENSKSSIISMLSRLPVQYKTEDMVLYLKRFHDNMSLDLSGITFTGEKEIGKFTTVIDGSSREVTGYVSGASYSLQMNYNQLKNYLNAIYDTNNSITFINSLNVVYANDKALLNVSVNMSKYYISYDGAQYTPEATPGVDIGTNDPYGTKSR